METSQVDFLCFLCVLRGSVVKFFWEFSQVSVMWDELKPSPLEIGIALYRGSSNNEHHTR